MKFDKDIRAILALLLTLAIIGGAFAGAIVVPDRFAALKDLTLLALGFYFGNKATMDRM